MSATYNTNLAIVTGCYCSAREFFRAIRDSGPDDLLDSVLAGLVSGAILGWLQGCRIGVIGHSIGYAIVGTSVDFAALKLKHVFKSFFEAEAGGDNGSEKKKSSLWRTTAATVKPDEEALAAKRAREQQLLRKIHALSKEES